MRLCGREHSARKTWFEGTCRARSPADTVAWLQPAAREIGVTRLANVTGLDIIGIPVWLAIRPNSKGLATSQGKGISDDSAKASALMESVESWHAENISLPVRMSDYASLAAVAAAVPPASLGHFSDALPRDDVPLAWVQGYDLISGVDMWIPLDCVSTNYVVSGRGTLESTFVQSSNGLAGGNNLLEAVNHALAEVIERHAIAAHEEAIRAFDPAIRLDPATVTNPYCRHLLDTLARRNVACALFDLAADIDVPVYACLILDAEEGSRWRLLPPFNGYGCHIDPAIALSRAITEAIQSRLTYITGSRDDILDSEYSRGNNARDLETLRTLIRDGAALRPFRDHAAFASELFEEDTAFLIGTLRTAGYSHAVAVDLTQPRLGIPVAKVVVPGMALPQMLVGRRPVTAPARPPVPAEAAR
jgi:ribosomal protein S12 methylthiotransferase accessory factor